MVMFLKLIFLQRNGIMLLKIHTNLGWIKRLQYYI